MTEEREFHLAVNYSETCMQGLTRYYDTDQKIQTGSLREAMSEFYKRVVEACSNAKKRGEISRWSVEECDIHEVGEDEIAKRF